MNTVLVVFLVSLIYATSFIDATTALAPTEKAIIKKTQCEPGDVYRMFGYDCSNMDLKEVPQNLRTSVKVISFFYDHIFCSDFLFLFSFKQNTLDITIFKTIIQF